MSSSGETAHDGPQEYIFRLFRTLTGATTEIWSGASTSVTAVSATATSTATSAATGTGIVTTTTTSTIPLNADIRIGASVVESPPLTFPTPSTRENHQVEYNMARRKSVDSATTTATDVVDQTTQGEELQRTTSTTSSRTRRRNSITEKLRKLGREIKGLGRGTSDVQVGVGATGVGTTGVGMGVGMGVGVGKGMNKGKGAGKEKGLPALPVTTTTPPTLPPTPISSPRIGGHVKLLSMVAEGDETMTTTATPTVVDDAEELSSRLRSGGKPIPPEPESLAKRIQDLIDSMPFPKQGDENGKPRPGEPQRDEDGRPIPPPEATPVRDSKLLAFLSSATVMNGGGGVRKSIWSVLEGLGVPPHGFPPTGDEEERRSPETGEGEEGGGGEGGGGRAGGDDGIPDIFADTSSVMVYSPLIPNRRDLVELAELVDLEGDSTYGDMSFSSVRASSVYGSPGAGSSGWGQVWPLSAIWNAGTVEGVGGAVSTQIDVKNEVVVSGIRTRIDENGNRVRIRTARAWVPSDTKLSVQAMWWGYRLYLPPPVLEILDDKTLEAAKRAAMITTALTWFFNNLPIDALPLPVRPALLLLQRIAPFVGYIGTFISWSWKTVKSYDVGFGVTLTATWLLPIALIPGTWHENDFPKSPSPASPIPLPPVDLPSSPLPTIPGSPIPTIPTPATPIDNDTPLSEHKPGVEPPKQLPTPAPTEYQATEYQRTKYQPIDSPISQYASPISQYSPAIKSPPIMTHTYSGDSTSTMESPLKVAKWKRLIPRHISSVNSAPSPSMSLSPSPSSFTSTSYALENASAGAASVGAEDFNPEVTSTPRVMPRMVQNAVSGVMRGGTRTMVDVVGGVPRVQVVARYSTSASSDSTTSTPMHSTSTRPLRQLVTSPPMPLEVPPSSPLAHRLLQGPMMGNVPLPDENAPMPKFGERVRGVLRKRSKNRVG